MAQVAGDSPHAHSEGGEGYLGVRQQRGVNRPVRGLPVVAWERGLDQGAGSLPPCHGHLRGELGEGDRLDQPVHRHRAGAGVAWCLAAPTARPSRRGRTAPPLAITFLIAA